MATRTYPLGRLRFWIALVYALLVWAGVGDFKAARPLAAIGIVLAVVVQVAEAQRFAFERRVREALHHSGHSIKSATLALYGDERRAPEFQRVLRGERPLDFAKLEILLGDEFARHFATLTLIEKGPPTYVRDALKVLAGVTRKEGAA